MRIVTTLLVSLALAAPAPRVQAQAAPPPSAPVAAHPDSSGKVPRRFLTRRDVFTGLGFAAGTVAMLPADRWIARQLQDSTRQANRFFHNAARGFNTLGDPGALALGVGAYAVGLVAHKPRVKDIGLHTSEAVVFASTVTYLVKGTAGRARPTRNVKNSTDFRFGSGFGDNERSSFPSGHTTAAFAAAAAVTEEFARSRPGSQWIVGPVLYGAATMVGAARMYDNKHWASDVVVGAAVGTFSGWKLVAYNHDHPDNRVNRIFLHPTVGGSPSGGLALGFDVPTH
jgi:membrane-associated phospholipid phosphatase